MQLNFAITLAPAKYYRRAHHPSTHMLYYTAQPVAFVPISCANQQIELCILLNLIQQFI